MRKSALAIAVGSAVVTLMSGAGFAATLTQFNFNTSGAPTTVASGVTATSVVNVGLNFFNPSTNFATPYPTNVLSAAPGSGGTGFSSSTVTANPSSFASSAQFFSFTLTPGTGLGLTLDAVSFMGARGGGSTPRGVAIYTVVGSGSPVFHGAVDLQTVRPTLQSYSVPLSSLSNVSVPVTFRVYVFAGNTGSTVELDDLTVTGRVSPLGDPDPIPLPAASLAGTALLASGLVRRRR